MTAQATAEAPLVPWRPSEPHPRTRRFVRVAGALIGLGGSWLLAGLLMAALDLRPGVGWTTGAQDPFGIPTAIALVGAMTGVPALIAGFWIAPRAWRARSFGDWLVAEIVIALATDFIGLVLVAALFALPGLVAPTAGGALGALALMGVVIILGGVAVAPLVLPFTAAGGVLWVTGMWLFRAAANRVGVTGEAAP